MNYSAINMINVRCVVILFTFVCNLFTKILISLIRTVPPIMFLFYCQCILYFSFYALLYLRKEVRKEVFLTHGIFDKNYICRRAYTRFDSCTMKFSAKASMKLIEKRDTT